MWVRKWVQKGKSHVDFRRKIMRTGLKLVKGTLCLLLLVSINHPLSTTLAQGTAFTYQGRLNTGSNPANGSYNLTFALFTAGSGGSAAAGPVTNSATAVSNGLFTVTLDFGSGLF